MLINHTNTFNTPKTAEKNSQPQFTAQLRGLAIRSAIKEAKDAFQIGEITEILDNVERFGDKYTIINCAPNGLVTVTNNTFGDVVHKFNIKMNEKSNNKFLEMLRSFNSENSIMRCEKDLIDRRFSITRNKKSLYEYYSSKSMNPLTKYALDYVAKLHGILPAQKATTTIEEFKNLLLRNMASKF